MTLEKLVIDQLLDFFMTKWVVAVCFALSAVESPFFATSQLETEEQNSSHDSLFPGEMAESWQF